MGWRDLANGAEGSCWQIRPPLERTWRTKLCSASFVDCEKAMQGGIRAQKT